MKDCDFIPANYHAARKIKGAMKLRAGCVGALVSIMALWMVAHHHRIESAKAMLPEIARQEEQIAIHLAKKAAMDSEKADLNDHQRLLAQLEEHTSVVLVLSDISRRMPDTIVLTEVSAECQSLARFGSEIESPKPAEPPPPGTKPPVAPPDANAAKAKENQSLTGRVTITGIAVDNPDVVQFAAALETSPLFDRIQMEVKGPTVWAGRRAQLFELTCELVEQQGGGR